jgi:hypothetical protein
LYLNSPPPPFSFILPSPLPGIVSADIVFSIYVCVYTVFAQLSSVKYIHLVAQSIPRKFSSWKTEILYLLNTNSPFSITPASRNHHPTVWIWVLQTPHYISQLRQL